MQNNTVKFDPGIGEFVIDFNEYINQFYSGLMNLRTIHQKRARFKLYFNKIQDCMKNNMAFYLGCLLWAYYIYNSNINEPKNITGNPFLNMTKEQQEDYDYMIQVNFMENYFDSFERDSLYYTGKNVQISKEWKDILSLYSEFLQLNNGFVSVKTTADIMLPEKLKASNFDVDINEIIQKSIKQEDLNILFNINKIAL